MRRGTCRDRLRPRRAAAAFPVHAARRQLYVPEELLERHGARPDDIFAGRYVARLNAALAELRDSRAVISRRRTRTQRCRRRRCRHFCRLRWCGRRSIDSIARRCVRAGRALAVAAAMADLARGAKPGADCRIGDIREISSCRCLILDSPSYFVATAAAELGFFKEEGVDIELEHAFGGKTGPERLRDGVLHFFAGPAYSATRAMPGWRGARIFAHCRNIHIGSWRCAPTSTSSDGDLNVLKGCGSRPRWKRRCLACAICWPRQYRPRPRQGQHCRDARGQERTVARTRAAPTSLTQGIADAFWGNGMRVAIAEKLGVGKLYLDLRRGDGAAGRSWYNFAALRRRPSV